MRLLFFYISLAWLCTFLNDVSAQSPISFSKKKMIFRDDFEMGLDTSRWAIETIPHPSNNVHVEAGKLWLNTRDGATVWYKQVLPKNYLIRYIRTVVVDGGDNARLSDLNNFWQASDPRSKDLFTRNGILEKYDSLQLYYAGIGAGHNKHSRFRKYPGTGERTLLKEYTDSAYLLQANKTYTISILQLNGTTQLWVDDKVWFSLTDSNPLPVGCFGLRSTKSRQWVDDMEIWEIRD
jgi:rhamnogalacturonan endolyase